MKIEFNRIGGLTVRFRTFYVQAFRTSVRWAYQRGTIEDSGNGDGSFMVMALWPVAIYYRRYT